MSISLSQYFKNGILLKWGIFGVGIKEASGDSLRLTQAEELGIILTVIIKYTPEWGWASFRTQQRFCPKTIFTDSRLFSLP